MTQQKNMKKAKCCGCFDWFFARRARRSPSKDLDSFAEEIQNAGAQDDAGKQGQSSLSLVFLQNASQPLAVVQEELPSDTQDADGGVENGGKEGSGKGPQTLIITLHLVKRERANKPLDETTTAVKGWTQESYGQSVNTLIITLLMIKRENIQELPFEHQGTAGDAPSSRSKAVTEPPKKTLKSSHKKQDAPQNTIKKTVRFNFHNLNTFVKDRELFCGYDYFKYGFPLSNILSELQKLKEITVMPQKEPAKEAVYKLPEPQKIATEKAADSNKNTEPQRLTGILKKGKTASTGHKCLRFNFQNLNSFVKDRELYCGYDYFKYGFPLSIIRSELQKPKEKTVKPQQEPPKGAANKVPEPQKTATVKETDSYYKNTEPQRLTGILKKGKTASTGHKCLRFNLQNLNSFVKDRELYCGYEYFKYGFPLSSIRSELQELKERTVNAAPLQVTQSPNVTSRLHQQPVRSASNSLRGAPRHLGGRATQRSNDYFQHNSGRNATHTYTNSRHSQHRQHNSSGHVSHRYETRYFYEAQTHPGPNSRSRRRAKRGTKPSDGDVLGAPGEYTAS